MRKKNLYLSISTAVKTGKLKEPFTVGDVNENCSNLLENAPSFLSKHRVGNPGNYTAYFIREKDDRGIEIGGLYRLYVK